MKRAAMLLATGATLVAVSCGQSTETSTQTSPPSATPTAAPSTAEPSSTGAPTPSRPTHSTPATRPSSSTRPTPTSTATSLPAWLRGSVVTRLPTSRRVVALTFDGGAGAQGAASILATLARERVAATFFFTGGFVQANPAIVGTVARRGYVIGDHTVTHPHLTQLSTARVAAEVTGGAAAITAVTGTSPRPWFRFPYGEYDARTLQIVHGLGYGAIGWTVDSLGWKGTSAGTAADVVRRVRAALVPGAIVLMHIGANPDDHTTYDADALPALIAAIRAAGYGFVTVASAS